MNDRGPKSTGEERIGAAQKIIINEEEISPPRIKGKGWLKKLKKKLEESSSVPIAFLPLRETKDNIKIIRKKRKTKGG